VQGCSDVLAASHPSPLALAIAGSFVHSCSKSSGMGGNEQGAAGCKQVVATQLPRLEPRPQRHLRCTPRRTARARALVLSGVCVLITRFPHPQPLVWLQGDGRWAVLPPPSPCRPSGTAQGSMWSTCLSPMRNPLAARADGRWPQGARAPRRYVMLGIEVSKATRVCTLVHPHDQRVC